MDERFSDIFRELYDEFVVASHHWYNDWSWPRGFRLSSEPRSTNVALLVRDSLERAIGRTELQQQLRWDARYFLLINFSQMIAEPVQADPERDWNFEELAADIQADAEVVLRAAASAFPRPENHQISGGDVLQAVAANYIEMKVARYRVWN